MLVCVSHSSGFNCKLHPLQYFALKFPKNVMPKFEVTLEWHLLWCKTFMCERKKDLKPRHSCLTIPFHHCLIMSTYICSFRFNMTPVRLISRGSPCTICPDQTPSALLLFAFQLTPCWNKTNFHVYEQPHCVWLAPLGLLFNSLMKNHIEGIKSLLFLVSSL